jgi:hypothetical protein
MAATAHAMLAHVPERHGRDLAAVGVVGGARVAGGVVLIRLEIGREQLSKTGRLRFRHERHVANPAIIARKTAGTERFI